MTVRTLKLLPNNRNVQRGFYRDGNGNLAVTQGEYEVLDYKLDWTELLDGDTISTSTWSVNSVTKDSDTNTTTSATVWLSAPNDNGYAENTIVTAAGRTLEARFYIHNSEPISSTDYGAL